MKVTLNPANDSFNKQELDHIWDQLVQPYWRNFCFVRTLPTFLYTSPFGWVCYGFAFCCIRNAQPTVSFEYVKVYEFYISMPYLRNWYVIAFLMRYAHAACFCPFGALLSIWFARRGTDTAGFWGPAVVALWSLQRPSAISRLSRLSIKYYEQTSRLFWQWDHTHAIINSCFFLSIIIVFFYACRHPTKGQSDWVANRQTMLTACRYFNCNAMPTKSEMSSVVSKIKNMIFINGILRAQVRE